MIGYVLYLYVQGQFIAHSIFYILERSLTVDDVIMVMQNIEKMSDILVSEEEENGQQGLCLVYLLAEDILDQLVTWCLGSGVYENKIKYELLKILESLIG